MPSGYCIEQQQKDISITAESFIEQHCSQVLVIIPGFSPFSLKLKILKTTQCCFESYRSLWGLKFSSRAISLVF